MRLLTHNMLRNNSAAAKGQGFPLKITATEIRVDDNENDEPLRDCPNGEDDGAAASASSAQHVALVKGVLGTLDWPALVQAASEMGLPTGKCLPLQLTEELADDSAFLQALYHILLNVHLVEGVLTCPATGREFPVHNGIPNMTMDEDECCAAP